MKSSFECLSTLLLAKLIVLERWNSKNHWRTKLIGAVKGCVAVMGLEMLFG